MHAYRDAERSRLQTAATAPPTSRDVGTEGRPCLVQSHAIENIASLRVHSWACLASSARVCLHARVARSSLRDSRAYDQSAEHLHKLALRQAILRARMLQILPLVCELPVFVPSQRGTKASTAALASFFCCIVKQPPRTWTRSW